MTIEERLNNIELNQTLLDQRLSELELKILMRKYQKQKPSSQLKPPQEANPQQNYSGTRKLLRWDARSLSLKSRLLIISL